MEDIKTLNRVTETLTERTLTTGKFYPFFEMARLNTTSEKYPQYDFGVLTIAVIGYLLHQGHLKSVKIEFESILEFVKELILEIYGEELEESYAREFLRYFLVEKLWNKGKPFEWNYFDIEKKEMRQHKLRYIEYEFDEVIKKPAYFLTSDAIDFYLQTKEFGEESKVTIHLLLLKKLIESKDYISALQTIININIEIKKELRKKNEIIEDLALGNEESYLKYTDKIIEKCEQEENLFKHTMKSLETMEDEFLHKVDINQLEEDEQQFKLFLFELKTELTKTNHLHGELLRGLAELAKKKEQLMVARRKNVLKGQLSFITLFEKLLKTKRGESIPALLSPLWNPFVKKQFSTDKLNDCLLIQRDRKEEKKIEVQKDKLVQSENGLTEEVLDRMYINFKFYFQELCLLLIENKSIYLREFIEYLSLHYTSNILSNKDLINFLIAISRKGEDSNLRNFNYNQLAERKWQQHKIENIYLEVADAIKNKELFGSTLILSVENKDRVVIDVTEVTNFKYSLERTKKYDSI